MTDTADNAPEVEAQAETPETISNVVEAAPEAAPEAVQDKLDFVLDKYRKEGRTDQEAAIEQAKAYKELQSKFGAFTGAPDEYTIELPEEMADRINMEDFADDPLIGEFKDMAKELGINGEAFNKLAALHFKGLLADQQSFEEIRKEEFEALGKNGARRLENISDWSKNNLDAETAKALEDALTSARAVGAIEALIAKTRNAGQVDQVQPAPSISKQELSDMQMAKDEYGNPKMSTDKEYAAKVRGLYAQMYGNQPHNVTIGAR